jgi:hypothetical protein
MDKFGLKAPTREKETLLSITRMRTQVSSKNQLEVTGETLWIWYKPRDSMWEAGEGQYVVPKTRTT